IHQSTAGFVQFSFGSPSLDIPVVGDFDVPGRAEAAVFRSSTGQWFILGHPGHLNLGQPGDMPVPGDYDGTGTDQIAVYRPSTGQWLFTGHPKSVVFGGGPSDIPIPGDYDGIGKDEPAFFRASTAQWFILNPVTGMTRVVPFGSTNVVDIPAPGD